MSQFARARQIFLAACHLPEGEQTDFLDRECGDDAGLRADVASLLENDLPPDRAAVESVEPTLARPGEPSTGERIGPYRIIHEIGRGGIGIVYAAEREDDQFKRRIALKVVKRGMDTEDILRRFDLERQLLAALNHPNIARLYDGGRTDDGRPYFVMEYVDGQPIDAYCDHHRLRIGERLRLFQAVCSAVHHAHQNLVVHRDLKPANILVTEKGVPKLLDFGIAKLINPDLSLLAGPPTSPELRIMTPEYASPEQVRGAPITTATDVYSLGVLLYEIVSGHRPYQFRSRVKAEIERVICEEDPERPSTAVTRVDEPPSTVTPESISRSREGRPHTLQRQLRGDIDNIVLMAMRKEPQRRYLSAEQFAEDIGHHLRGLPVIARRDTAGYRFAKFVRRNRGGVAVAGAVAVVVAVAAVISTWGWQDAASARRETAEVVATLAQAGASRLEVLEGIKGLDASTGLRHEWAQEYLEIAEAVSRYDRSPGTELALTYAHIGVGDSLSSTREGGLGDSEGAMEHYQEALRIAETLAATDSESNEVRVALALSHVGIGDARNEQRDLDGARASYRAALDLLEPEPDLDARSRRRLAIVLLDSGKMCKQLGLFDETIDCYERSYLLRRQLRLADPTNLRTYRDESRVLIRLAYRRQETGAIEDALDDYRAALELDEKAAAVEEALGLDESWAQRHRAFSLLYVGGALRLLGRAEEAVEHLAEARRVMDDRLRDNLKDAKAHLDLAVVLDALAAGQLAAGDLDAARDNSQSAVRKLDVLVEWDQKSARYREVGADLRMGLADVLLAASEAGAALDAYRGAGLELAELLGDSPNSVDIAEKLARSRLGLGQARLLAGDPRTAEDDLERALAGYQELHDALPSQVTMSQGLATTCRELAGLSADRGDHDDARALIERGLDAVADDPSPQGADLRRRLQDARDR